MTEPHMTAPLWPALSFAEATARLTAPGSPFAVAETPIRGVPTRIWANAPLTLRDVFVAGRAHGQKTFLVYEDERATFEAFGRATLALAADLIRGGVRPGDRVVVAMRNLPEWPVAFFAAILAGAVVTPLNAWWTGPELDHGFLDSGARVAIVDEERWARIAERRAAYPALARVLLARAPAAPGTESLSDIIGPVADWAGLPEGSLPEVAVGPEDVATLFYTSGTTGRSKGAIGTHRAGACGVMAHPFSAARAFLRRGEPVPAPDPAAPQRVALLSIPLFHVTGCFATLVPNLYRGGRLVMMRRWDLARAMALIERERCTSAGGVPTIAFQLLDGMAAGTHDLSSLETISYGGAPAPAELVRRLRAAFPKAQPATGWGMTETSGTFTHHQGEDYVHRPDSCGPALPVCETRAVDPEGRTLPPGEVGELWVKGPNVVAGYWNRPDADAEVMREGWLRTGDLARIDAEGFVTIVDRAKDMLIRGGENIYCGEVESVLYEHPAVVDAALVGIPHPTLGEEPGAVVAIARGAQTSEEELRAFVAARLALFKVPVRVLLHEEILPRNPNGKILKSELKKLF
ncbi:MULTISPECIES: class I adenylate-forming enzyme family protein [Methylobacterium]|jgi:long-chain acyl-CoA synthetase|uniref:class I adenylate-forming enzyme family protein n=1 Tax=Methylobacterium TaxID=407 RepID=UPI0008EFDA08|nr:MULTISPECIES: class I adenylate-forming enzyme family protein [Methylobacterium]MBZ6415077.1 acyl--CoA ligase [Methylobacterium sp.]MBK3397365.1 acyl--CoA ligase [Methylobacterium ajmalii]MBK3412596.1 acyl--CoA ligase [Methylobacterium ajmalii]MBK3421606.1 acyl--CoA ligase [Methylobacterium ajmalii]SFF31804.1 Acyl-CoA synthetase (AMP-forming)/AMP-acid ligase II [Methylobacterium sp. yr596]